MLVLQRTAAVCVVLQRTAAVCVGVTENCCSVRWCYRELLHCKVVSHRTAAVCVVLHRTAAVHVVVHHRHTIDEGCLEPRLGPGQVN